MSLDERILIIGAGPAGLSAALSLREKGYRRITVLEREPVVGGKCHSLVVNGTPYDLGANLTTPRYTTIRPLARQLGLTFRKLQERRLVNVSAEDFPSLVDANKVQRLVVRGGGSLFVTARSLTGVDRDGYAGLPRGVRRPFSGWLERHGLARFREVFANLFIAYGYGLMDDLPAAYALKFFDPIHLGAAIDVMLGEEVETTMDIAEGFQELWERVDRQYAIGTRRGVEVQQIHRSPRGVHVVYHQDGQTVREDHDRLILACPLDAALGFLDASPAEERLFRQLRYFDYFVTAATVRGAPDVATYVQPYSRRLTPGQPTVFYPPIEGDPNQVFLFYAYGGEGVGAPTVRANITSLLASPEVEGELCHVHTTKQWRYFPHVTSEAMLDGWYEDVEAMQGEYHTLYAGEALSFPLVELVARYSRHLVERWF